MKILVTRPDPDGTILTELLKQQGHEVRHLPLFQVRPLPIKQWWPSFLLLHPSSQFIFVSKNAAHFFCKEAMQSEKWEHRTQAWAVGPGTADALANYGLTAFSPPHAAGSEAFLALPGLAQVRGEHFVIVSGDKGRDLIFKTLKGRGAHVDILPIYEVELLQPEPLQHQWLQEYYDVILVSSTMALRWLNQYEPQHTARVSVLSQTMLDLATQFGFHSFLKLEIGSNEEILKRLGGNL